MTQRHRDQEKLRDRANLRRGVDHALDDAGLTAGDQRDSGTVSGGKEGLHGVRDIRKEVGYKRLLEELDWWIAHADSSEPGVLSPMQNELDPVAVFGLAGLTKEQIAVWTLKAEGQKVATIAEYLDLTPGLVQSRINWGRVKLKVWVSDALLDTD